METVAILQHLEFAEPRVIRQLFDYIYHSAEETREQVNECYIDFRTGLNDPAREVAFLEKQAFIKKPIMKAKRRNWKKLI
jgi:hypothetical protein